MPTPAIERWRIDEMVALARPSLDAGRRPCVAEIAARLRAAGRPADANTIRKYLRAEGAWEPAPPDIRAVAASPIPEAPNPPGRAGEAVAGRIGGVVAAPEAIEADELPREVEGDGENLRLKTASLREITTLDDLLAHCKVDPAKWKVKRWKCTHGTVAMRMRKGQGDDGRNRPDEKTTVPVWWVWAEFEPVKADPRDEWADRLIARMASHSPRYELYRPRSIKKPCCIEIDLFDAHLAKLAWRPESLDEYDLEIAERVFQEAIADTLDRVVGHEFDQAIFPIGNDFLQIDGPRNTTTAGTPVDTDGRFAKVLHAGQMALVRGIEEIRKRVDRVVVVAMGGNHDELTTLHNARFLWAWFRNAANIEVDMQPITRKYLKYGRNLIGFSHGHLVKSRDLPALMMQEAKRLYAETDHYEIHRGHLHKSMQFVTAPVDTLDGITIRHLHALSGRDKWHYDMGFYGGRRAAEAFVWSAEEGMIANLIVPVRPTNVDAA